MTEVSVEDRDYDHRTRDWIDHMFHELPTGVLWGFDGASAAQCRDMLSDLDAFATFCERLGLDDHAEFIDASRWYLDHYPHYIGRRRHFVDYSTYIHDRSGPQRVPAPPNPTWF